MRNIMSKFKKSILKSKIKKYDLKMEELDVKAEVTQQMIIKGIVEGRDEAELDRLRLERDQAYEKYIEMVDQRGVACRQLMRA